MKTSEGQEELRRVLQAVGYALPEVGYCQGMNFIASTLIASLCNNEELAFWVFMNLLITRDMKTLFLPVRDQFLKADFVGRARTASEELSNGLVDQVSYA